MAFLFRNLDVYKLANEFVGVAHSLAKEFIALGETALADQLQRSSSSITANIAEGYGRWHIKDKMQFYRFAFGSVNECVSHLDTALRRNLVTPDRHQQLCDELERVAQMMQRLIAAVAARSPVRPV